MAKGTKELKARITGVKNIQKITSAMEMVATQKLKRLQNRAEAARPYAEKVQEMVAQLAKSVRPDLSPLLQPRTVHCVQHLVVSADKGLCGGYNANTVRMVQRIVAEADEGVEQRINVLGSKGARLLEAKGVHVDGLYEDVVEKIDFIRVRNLVRDLVAQFLEGAVDRLDVVYTAFLSAGTQRTATVTLLPIDPSSLGRSGEQGEGDDGEGQEHDLDFLVEPDQETLLKSLLPKFLEVKVYSAVLESLASEFTARRNAMKQATDAADDMIQSLTREYNKARQEAITSELLEIVSGAEALN